MGHELALGALAPSSLFMQLVVATLPIKVQLLYLITISLQCQMCHLISKIIHDTSKQMKPHYMLRLTDFLASNDNQQNYMLQFAMEIGSWEW